MKLLIVVAIAIFRYAAATPRLIRTVEFGHVYQHDWLVRSLKTHVEPLLDASMSISAPQPPHQLLDSPFSLNYPSVTVNNDMLGFSAMLPYASHFAKMAPGSS